MFRIPSVDVEPKFTIREASTTHGGVHFKLIAPKHGQNVQSECVHAVTVHVTGLKHVDSGLLQGKKGEDAPVTC